MTHVFRLSLSVVVLAVALLPAAALTAQMRTGPSPEMRALLDELRTALGGTPDGWEAFAQKRFTPALLEQRSPDQRRQSFERLRTDFGTIEVGGVMRGGPSAPIEVRITGSTGEAGVIELEVDESSSPRISSFGVKIGNGGGRDGAPGAGATAAPVNSRMTDDELSTALDGYFAKLTAEEAFSGVALVARNADVVFHKAYGLADRANQVSNTLRTRFNIGSINKIFTQIAIHQLARDGTLALTDTVGKFFPDYPQVETRAATIEQLLAHKAGVADIFGPEFSKAPKDQFRSNADYFRFVSALPPLFAPGARAQYCNGCYITLGAIIERASGMPYERYVAEHVFKPAGMTNSGYQPTERDGPGLAIGYTRRVDGPLESNTSMHGAAGSAGGGGYSTAEDLFAFVKAVRAGQFPGAEANMGIGGGAPGINAVIEAGSPWTVIVLANLDPPAAEGVGSAISRALRGPTRDRR